MNYKLLFKKSSPTNKHGVKRLQYQTKDTEQKTRTHYHRVWATQMPNSNTSSQTINWCICDNSYQNDSLPNGNSSAS